MVKQWDPTESSDLKKLLHVLNQDFCNSANPNSRKGGLLGIAVTAVALGRVRSVSLYSWKINSSIQLISSVCDAYGMHMVGYISHVIYILFSSTHAFVPQIIVCKHLLGISFRIVRYCCGSFLILQR